MSQSISSLEYSAGFIDGVYKGYDPIDDMECRVNFTYKREVK